MIVLQFVLFCALFTLMVKLGVGNDPLNGLFFYPKPVQEKVYELGLTDRETVGRKRKRFMTLFLPSWEPRLCSLSGYGTKSGAFGRLISSHYCSSR